MIVKLTLVSLVVLVLGSLALIGGNLLVSEYLVRDYDSRLTERVYVDSVEKETSNLVFYKEGCPYCQAGKQAIIEAAQASDIPTFYINVDTEDGQFLVKKYKVERAASLVRIREGKSEVVEYAYDNSSGQIEVNRASLRKLMK
ncbi:thioredoxin [Streptococcus danieliae]|uniref:Thioredoxin n=2 Tax=Streptococcus danieliae TaxID=747656 RepID=A0A7X3KCA0_9STRE|nr:thioredoxin [Streptococcus danieliae]MVX59034.1 thioredoxin [Streptococcus danieliae]